MPGKASGRSSSDVSRAGPGSDRGPWPLGAPSLVQDCEAKLREVDVEFLFEEWPSCFWHPRLKCMLIVYVDDFMNPGQTR